MTGHDRLAAARRFLVGQGLHAEDERSRWTPLTGGVSSDLWRVELPGRTLCVKAALPRLRVADEWFAPVGRNAVEYEWLTFAQEHVPGCCPRVLAHDAEAGFFAMEYLPPQHHRLWKAALLAGDVDPAFAGRVGDVVGRLHKASAADASVEQRFATDANFDVLRITPYLRVSAERNPDVADRLHELADRLAGTRLALVHGDLSPKNILIHPTTAILLDAECAWFGDPAFDLAFCLTHLLLKTRVRPDRAAPLREAAERLLAAHRSHLDWEPPHRFDERVAALLPALLLARVDGSSPVEYLTAPGDRSAVREAALRLLDDRPGRTADVLDRGAAALAGACGTRPVTPGAPPGSSAAAARGIRRGSRRRSARRDGR